MEVIRTTKRVRTLANGDKKEYIYQVKCNRLTTTNTTKGLPTEVKQKIRDDVSAGFKKKNICTKYNVSYYVLREILAE